jgi:hypothetical protein
LVVELIDVPPYWVRRGGGLSFSCGGPFRGLALLDDHLILKTGSYSSSLTFDERRKLRSVVKRVHLQHYPSDMVTDYEADKLIDALGPEVGKQMIEKASRRGMFS